MQRQVMAAKKIQRVKLDRTLNQWFRSVTHFCKEHLEKAMRHPHANLRRILTWINRNNVRASRFVREYLRNEVVFS